MEVVILFPVVTYIHVKLLMRKVYRAGLVFLLSGIDWIEVVCC